MHIRKFFFAIGACSIWACNGCSKSNGGSETGNPDPPVITVPSTNYDITQLNDCLLFERAPITAPLQRQDYDELSGIAASLTNPGILYMHTDSKNAPVVMTNAAGEDLGKLVLDGITTLNPEDISVGPGPEPGKNYIYFADIGDNKFSRSNIAVYRFEEPVVTGATANTTIHITNISRIQLKYPGGSFNAETILVDPLTKDLFIASKEKGKATIYKAAFPQSTSDVISMVAVLKTPLDLLTAGDISTDGKEIVLRNKGQIWYWPRTAGSVVDALLKAPQMAPYAGNEHQGEGIGFATDGKGYYTNTEIRDYPGAVSNLSLYRKK
ncbi:MAG: hypothetical protein J7578_16715 [Chitinophagaceae bacterium]|nr:hypothetical protein [Chitinophagaceae bacterium]